MYEQQTQMNNLITIIGFEFDRDITKVWALDIPVQTINIGTLVRHLDFPFWFNDGITTPRQVLLNNDLSPEHRNRIQKADTSYALDIMWYKGRYLLLDGLHRLCKLVHQRETLVSVRIVTEDHILLIEK